MLSYLLTILDNFVTKLNGFAWKLEWLVRECYWLIVIIDLTKTCEYILLVKIERRERRKQVCVSSKYLYWIYPVQDP